MRLKPLPYQNKATAIFQKYIITFVGFSLARITSCDKISAFNYSGPIWGFHQGHWQEAPAAPSLPSASRGTLVCTNCLSSPSQNQLERSDTHRRRFWKRFMGRGNCTFYGWREGVSIWYLVMVDIYGKSYWRVGPPYYIDHRPSLVSWTSWTRCPRPNLQFWFWFSPDVKVDIILTFWHHLMSQPQTLPCFLAVTIKNWRNRSNRLFAYW